MTAQTETISSTFIWRRIHSLMGLWLILYLFEHLVVNSQATLWLGDDGIGFVRLVNSLESLPYLQVIEMVFIGVPFAIHMVWGVKRALMGKPNSGSSDGSVPSLQYERSKAYTWQRYTSWILLVGVLAHVVQMRFVEMPKKTEIDNQTRYTVKVSHDEGLNSLAERIHVRLMPLDDTHVTAVASTPGKAMLLMVRDTFKSPWMAGLYTIFVLAAAFHAFNGFWTSLITWGAMLSYRSQKAMIPLCWMGCGLLAFLGLAAIWGSYWINLRT